MQDLWNIHGIGLSDDVLEQDDRANDKRIIPGGKHCGHATAEIRVEWRGRSATRKPPMICNGGYRCA